jgi:ubiquinone/menaquinone biosynthesis C-methylase UbiE
MARMPTIQRLVTPIYARFKKAPEIFDLDPRWTSVRQKLKESKKIIDLGCGNNPVEGASAAVDLYVEPKERILGVNPSIHIENMKKRGIDFVNTRVDGPLPFKDKEFDFAYSHHAFEHFEHPGIACDEAMRIAKSGVIITPSWFAEFMFGRPYHRWLMAEHSGILLFFRKRSYEDRPFGEHPAWDDTQKKWKVTPETNPFEILLNDGHWYEGRREMPALAKRIRKHWYSHSPIMEVMFFWDDRFEYKIYE